MPELNKILIGKELWELGISWERDNQVTKEGKDKRVNGLRIVGAHSDEVVSVLICQYDKETWEVYIEDEFCNATESKKYKVTDAILEHFERLSHILSTEREYDNVFEMFGVPYPIEILLDRIGVRKINA